MPKSAGVSLRIPLDRHSGPSANDSEADARLSLPARNWGGSIILRMKHPILTLAALTALGGCGQSPHCGSADAQGIVEALRPKEQFRSMLTMTVERTKTAEMAAVRDGSAARQKLARAVDNAVERHATAWEQNLVASWQRLSAAEARQVCNALNKRDQDTFMRFAQRLGPEAQSRNEPLIQRAAVEILHAI